MTHYITQQGRVYVQETKNGRIFQELLCITASNEIAEELTATLNSIHQEQFIKQELVEALQQIYDFIGVADTTRDTALRSWAIRAINKATDAPPHTAVLELDAVELDIDHPAPMDFNQEKMEKWDWSNLKNYLDTGRLGEK